MCGRYSLINIDELGNRFRIFDPSIGFRSHFNIAPGSTNPVIIQHEHIEAVSMQWGLVPHWSKDVRAVHRPINARAESLTEKPMFRGLLKDKRCLVPATGFYEWKKEGTRKIPFYLHLKHDPLFAFAGLYDIWNNPAGQGLHTYTIITTEPNDLMTPIHNRMPAILKREDEDRWLSGNALTGDEMREILAPYPPGEMESYLVSERVNNPRVDDGQLIQPVKGL